MADQKEILRVEAETLDIAHRWCAAKGNGWTIRCLSGRGGTAPVYSVDTPDGERALKILDKAFCEGDLGQREEIRVRNQVKLGAHNCPYIIKVYDGGRFEGRLYLLMSRAPGAELEKRLREVPRSKIRQIVDQVAQACIFLRGNGLCHRDVKSSNIFITDDFDRATLLDLSVAREINDPIGVGTDHNGQLPVVATSRYSPPEYLFRLLDPSPALWHALDIYQIGGLLHDLIMREPLFENEYRLSRENRYRFAWIVATVTPNVSATDVDQDLVFLARRALDKNYERRIILHLEDFLNDAAMHRTQGLEALGLSPTQKVRSKPLATAKAHRRVSDVARAVEATMIEKLRKNGVTATHLIESTDSDTAKIIEFKWDTARDVNVEIQNVTFKLRLEFVQTLDSAQFSTAATLKIATESGERLATIDLPHVPDESDVSETLANHSMAALGDLAMKALQAKSDPEGK